MIFDYQISRQAAETRRQDLMADARIHRIQKATRTRNAQTRPQRRWLGLGGRRAASQTTCPTTA